MRSRPRTRSWALAAVVVVAVVAVVALVGCGRPRAPAGAGLTLRGVVLTAARTPAADTLVIVDRALRTRTDATGEFAVGGLEPGPHAIAAFGAGELAAGLRVTVHPDRAPITIRLRRAARLIVTVRDESGRPIEGAVIDPDRRAVLTDAAGRAVMDGVLGSVEVTAPGYVATSTRSGELEAGAEVSVDVTLCAGARLAGRVSGPDAAALAGGWAWVSVTEPRAHDVVEIDARGRWEVAAMPAGRAEISIFRGPWRVAASTIDLDGAEREVVIELPALGAVEGAVVDAAGHPVPFADVYAHPEVHTRADEKGRFRLAGLPRQRLHVAAAADTRASAIVEVDVSSGAAEARLVLADGMVEGQVVDPSDAPLAGVRVTARNGDGIRAVLPPGGDITGDDGRFRIAPVVPGEHRLRLTRPGAAHDEKGLDRKRITVAAGSSRTITLPRTGVLRGAVTLDGHPARALSVAISGRPGAWWEQAFRDGTGTFEHAEVPAGAYTVYVSGPGFAARVFEEVAVTLDGVTDLGVIAVDAGRTLTGRVVDGDGVPVAGARVVAAIAERLELFARLDDAALARRGGRATLTDADGRFTLHELPDDVAVAAFHATLGRTRVTTAATGDVSLRLIATGTIRGRVEGGATGEVLTVSASGAHDRDLAPVARDGSFALTGLLPDVYEVQVVTGVRSGPTVGVEVTGGGVAEIVLAAPPAAPETADGAP